MWKLRGKLTDNNNSLLEESLMTLANGYIGVRGNFEEEYSEEFRSIRGTYINGFYDIVDVLYGESAYAFPKTQQKQTNVIDSQTIKIYLDGEFISLFNDKHSNYKRELYFDKGYMERSFDYRTKHGKLANIKITRVVSFVHRELFAIKVEVKYDGEIKILSTVNGEVKNVVDKNDPRLGHSNADLLNVVKTDVDGDFITVEDETKRSNLKVTCNTNHIFNCEVKKNYEISDTSVKAHFISNNSIVFTKYNVYTDSRRHKQNEGLSILKELSQISIDEILVVQEEYLNKFWLESDVVIDGHNSLQEAIRFNIYHLLQSVGKDRFSNISAKGLTGEGYEGHYFWDTEIYVNPVFLMTQPEIAKNLLMFRYNTLSGARNRARELGHKRGVKYPWRTIDGNECSAYFPAGTAQYHINSDIAYSFIQYYLFTNDLDFMSDFGAEVLFETARFWLDIGHFSNDGLFRIDSVTGPDEYTAIVNNNYFTNVMAKHNMLWAIKLYRLLKDNHSEKLNKVIKKIQMNIEEFKEMESACNNMYLSYDEVLGINPQDDSFLNKKVWDFENTPKENYPLLLHFHPLTIYRSQVLKQPDVVLAHFLLEDYTDFDTIKKSYDYYEKITTHDSSLSACIYGIMGSRIGYLDKAYDYFNESARLDLDNTHGNTKDGLHVANLAGTWMSIVYGFGGFRIKEEGITLNPIKPKKWGGYSFKIKYQGRLIEVEYKNKIKIKLLKGNNIKINVFNESILLNDEIFISPPRE